MFNIPKQITQGDSVSWSEILSDYKPSDGTLKCFIRGATKLDLIGVPHFYQWNFLITPAQSQTIKPGKYKTQFTFTDLLQNQKTLGTTELLVCPSFESLDTLETRSDDEIELEAVTKAIAKLAGGAVAEYRIGDRMMRYQDIGQLTQRQQYLRRRIAIASGKMKAGGRNVGVRFNS